MSNYYKPVVYVGIKVQRDMLFAEMGFKDYNEFYEWQEEKKLDLNGHHCLVGEFGYIYTDDDFVCIGQIISASGDEEDYPKHEDLLAKFEETKAYVNERLRFLKVSKGEVRIYHTTLCY